MACNEIKAQPECPFVSQVKNYQTPAGSDFCLKEEG